MQRLRSENVSSRRRRHTKNKLKNLEEDKKKDQKVVDCLYFGLMCCDMPCSILWATSSTDFILATSLLSVSFDSYLFSNAISELRIKISRRICDPPIPAQLKGSTNDVNYAAATFLLTINRRFKAIYLHFLYPLSLLAWFFENFLKILWKSRLV